MGSLASMCPHVSVEFARVFEGPAADGAGERPLLGVDSTVDIKVLLHAESLAAVVATVGAETRLL